MEGFSLEEVYQQRIVSFIDIMGFKTHIGKTIDNSEYAQKILNVMRKVEGTAKELYDDEFLSQYNYIGKEVSVFSDSIIISYPLVPSALFLVLMDLVHIQLEFMFNGIIFRGGIVIDNLHHKRNIVFGPGMIRAYKLESEFAVYPRVIITDETIEEGLSVGSHNPVEIEKEYVYNLLKKDIDGFYFIDYLKQYQELDYEEYYITMMLEAKKLILNELFYETDKHVLEKYKWLRKYYNSTIDDMGFKKKRDWKIPKKKNLS